MPLGIWTAASGAAAQSQQVDIVANNLANADTLGFKKDVQTFREYMATLERDHEAADIKRGPIKDQDFYPLDGRDSSYVIIDGTHTNFKQGNLRVTNSNLDLALEGPGFIEVSTPSGIRYTRQGSLKLAMDGRLVTTDGHPVLAAQPLGLNGPAAQGGLPGGIQGAVAAPAGVDDASRFISLKDRGNQISINPRGEIYAGDEKIAQISVREVMDSRKLQKRGANLYESRDPNNFLPTANRTQVRQGMLETSNVNPVEEMTNLIKANRLFEHDLKALKTYGDLMQREVNDIGKL
ncbi:MAG: flagellar hook-basal body protein [Bdellovibrionales bacterium]|nr:flagellar hook-basal body protein [Bdellovibrionales bacterium]